MDKLKSKINDCLYNFIEDHDIQLPEGHRAKYVTKILAAAKHGVCVDCNLYKICQSRNEWPMQLDCNDDYQAGPKDQYCSEFDQKENGELTTNDLDNPDII